MVVEMQTPLRTQAPDLHGGIEPRVFRLYGRQRTLGGRGRGVVPSGNGSAVEVRRGFGYGAVTGNCATTHICTHHAPVVVIDREKKKIVL